MLKKIFLIFILVLSLNSCSKKDVAYEPKDRVNPYKLYQEGFEAFEKGDYFYADKKFTEAELNFEIVDFAAKSAIMSSYSLYGINFYSDALINLERYLKKYPTDNNVMYAHYLIAIIHYEQIQDEKRDLQPLLDAKKKIEFFLKKYPDTDYAIDLEFKQDLIQNQLAAKELYVAKYYISTQKWVPAINRLKVIVNDYEKTVFIEEALHRLVEIHYYLGLKEESEKYAKILGYNYNSSEWFEQAYKVLNKDYKIKKKVKSEDSDSFFKKIINKIK
ncbi:outer membrane protein assembly factor BamD [Pelagibacterales bacterium SAG-MED05]|nr:outer membrane protein assembly factor BamD [Pelagibacterales bacterium SAG-MED05]